MCYNYWVNQNTDFPFWKLFCKMQSWVNKSIMMTESKWILLVNPNLLFVAQEQPWVFPVPFTFLCSFCLIPLFGSPRFLWVPSVSPQFFSFCHFLHLGFSVSIPLEFLLTRQFFSSFCLGHYQRFFFQIITEFPLSHPTREFILSHPITQFLLSQPLFDFSLNAFLLSHFFLESPQHFEFFSVSPHSHVRQFQSCALWWFGIVFCCKWYRISAIYLLVGKWVKQPEKKFGE